jgi:hypothetical protein
MPGTGSTRLRGSVVGVEQIPYQDSWFLRIEFNET